MLRTTVLRPHLYILALLLGLLLISGCQDNSDLRQLSDMLIAPEELGTNWYWSDVSTKQESFTPDEDSSFLVESAARILSGYYNYSNRVDNYYVVIMHRVNYYSQPTSWLNDWQFTDDLGLTSPNELVIDVPNSAEYYIIRCLREMPDLTEKATTICQLRQGYGHFISDVTVYVPSTMSVDMLTDILRPISAVSEEKILMLTEVEVEEAKE